VGVRLGSGSDTKVGMAAPGNMAGDAHTDHVRGFVEGMPVRQSAASHGRTNDVAFAAGTVTGGAIGVVSLFLVFREEIELICAAQSAPQCHFSHLTGAMMEAGHEIVYDFLVTGSTFLFRENRRMADEIPGMGHRFVVGVVHSVVAPGTTDLVMR